MSSFIPMVSSSPPPMDDGGGFDWDDDDDEFGTFASADTSYKEVDQDTSSGWNKFDSNTQNDTNNAFADFSAFDKNTVSNSTNPSDGIESSGDVNCSKEEINDLDFHVSSKNGEPVGGALTDSGMYSAEISPVQEIDKQGTSQKGCEHSDSLDDVQTDSLSENADQNFDSKHQDNNIAKDEMANVSRDYVDKDGNVSVYKSDSVIVQNISSENTFLRENENRVCSKSTVSNNESIPISDLEHSTQSTDIFKSEHNSGKNKMAENKDTNDITNDLSPPGCEITETHLKLETKTMEASISNDNFPVQEIDNGDKENGGNGINEGEVKEFIDNEVISEALKRVQQSGDIENERLDISAGSNLSYQKNIYENSAATIDVQKSDSKDECQYSHPEVQNSEKSLDLEDSNKTRGNVEINSNTFIKSDSLQSESNLSNPVKSDMIESSEDNNSHICHSSRQNSSPESSDDLQSQGLNNSADKSDQKCDNDSAKTESDDTDRSVNNTTENDNEFCDDEFGAFSANQSSQDLSFRQSSIPYNDSDTSLSQKENSADEEINDSIPGSNKEQVKQGEESNHECMKQVTVLSSKPESVEENNDGFGDFSMNDSKQDINHEKLDNHSSNISKSEIDQFDDDDDEFGDFGDFSSGTTVVASNSVGKDGSFANFTSESTENQDESWAAFDEPQTSIGDKDFNNADADDWGAFGDEESTSDSPVKEADAHQMQNASIQNMSKHEKLIYAVTSCFLENIGSKLDKQFEDLSNSDKDVNTKSPPDVWVQIKSLQTSKEVSYQWSKSEWNSQLFTTLHIDTRNVLIGHKKAQVPIFAAGLTLLEPVKGSSDGVLKPEVLVDTNKPDSAISQTQETIPPAQFDWTSSGLTNPLEANNKTLNLDFLIQDQSTKSSELESEFLKPDPPAPQKPSIQPLENILANLKTSSTYKPQTRDENIGREAQKVVQSLPSLSFMKSRVLMFPIHMDDKN